MGGRGKMEKIIYTLAIAGVGGYIGLKLKIPAGAMVGAMLAVGTANLLGFSGQIPGNFRTVAQICIGGIVGLNITRETVAGLKSLALPAAVLAVSMIGFGLLAGYIISRVSNMDIITAFFSSSPGGMTEMTIMAESAGGNAPQVALMQLARMLSIVSFLPLIIKWALRVRA